MLTYAGKCGIVQCMYLRRKLEAKVADQQRKISELERQVAEARAYLAGLQDSLKLLPQEGGSAVPETLREGSDLAKARELLRKEGKPLQIDELLKRMGKEVSRNGRGALGGNLGSYVRKGLIFTRPGPNLFGLVEFETQPQPEEPPATFGLSAP
jgi:uncharacterized coiled-coil protein SlyX